MSKASRETRLQIMLTEDELTAIDDWRFKHRMPSRAAAIRRLLMLGIASASQDSAKVFSKSSDYGVFEKKKSDPDD